MRKLFGLVLMTLVALLAMAAPAMAMDWRGADRAAVGKDEVINDDVTLTGTNVIVDGTVNGDVFAFGKSIVINGAVNGNLITGGDRVEIKGTVAGSVYGAATHVTVSGRIERTLATACSTVALEPGAYVGNATGLLAGNRAPQATATWNVWWRVLRSLGFMLAGLAMLALFPGLRRRYPAVVLKRPWRAPVAGLLVLVAVPIGALLLLITLIGIPLSLVIIALSPALIYLSQILVSWTAGTLLAGRVERLRNLPWPAIFLMGAVLTSVATALPGAGRLFGLAALLYGLGGLYYLTIQREAQEESL